MARDFFNKKPFIIAGPCSAEGPEQLNTVASKLQGNIDLFRAGIWKPRTRPNSFEGKGAIALGWLKTASVEFNIPCTTEVANAKHVEKALEAGIDVLWIGARTTVNPFSVQEIAEALKGVDIPVMIKNPVYADLQLWIGAVERVKNAGIEDIATVHRGFGTYQPSPYRNNPRWEIPIEFKRQFPEVPLFCDPSHIGGSRELIQKVSQKALDLDIDGLMIETHPDPDNALSDPKQQVTPNQLIEILNSLVYRKAKISDDVFLSRLEELRSAIDEHDEELIQILASRMHIAEEIGKFKQEHGVKVFQQERWNEIVEKALASSESLGLSKSFIKKVFDMIHEESIRKQSNIMN